jgi:hypothetical protein
VALSQAWLRVSVRRWPLPARGTLYTPSRAETVGKLLLKKKVLDLGLLGSPSVVAALVAATSPSTGSSTLQAAAVAPLGGTPSQR